MNTPSQQRAIDSASSAILNVAGAGSGKTTTIVNRIARLIKDGVAPDRFLCLTFTRKAANELKERLERKIGISARMIWCGTFHSVSYRILSKWGDRLGYRISGGQAIAVVPPEEANDLMASIVRQYQWKGTKTAIEQAKSELAHAGKWPSDPNIGRIIQEYWNRLKTSNALDYDQLLIEVHNLFSAHPDAREFYRNRLEFIFVDEYQDTDHQQYKLHEVISPKNLYAVGDPDQAIYGWRGADLSIILDFSKSHEHAETIRLEECFRCGTAIVQAANALISHNQDRIDKALIPVIPDGDVEVSRGGAEEIVSRLADEIFFHDDPGDIAVIARTHDILDGLVDACEKRGIPAFKVGAKTKRLEGAPGWKTFHAAVRLALNLNDDLAFWSQGSGFLGISGKDLDDLFSRAVTNGRGVWAQYVHEAPDNRISALKGKPEFARIVDLAKLWRTMDDFLPEEFISDLEVNCPTTTPAQWLEWLAGKDMHTELEKGSKDKITFLTAHAAKGLEWDAVYLVGFNQGDFPKQRSVREKHLEEERRLAYVAFTRARKSLVIFHDKEPSQFIKEAGL